MNDDQHQHQQLDALRLRLRLEREAARRYEREGSTFNLLRLMIEAERAGPSHAWLCDPRNEPAMRRVWDEARGLDARAVAEPLPSVADVAGKFQITRGKTMQER